MNLKIISATKEELEAVLLLAEHHSHKFEGVDYAIGEREAEFIGSLFAKLMNIRIDAAAKQKIIPAKTVVTVEVGSGVGWTPRRTSTP